MTQNQCDEESPLLQTEPTKTKRSPFPWPQFSIVLFLQLAEPLTSQVISPFAPQLIREIGITGGDEAKVGYYVGMMHSIFSVTQAMTVLHWSSLSDRIGRKPVILFGLFGLSLSMYCFGLSSTFIGLLISRGLCGALNGNIGVIKSMMVEMTDTTNIALVFAYFPIAWSTGSALGPMIGGSLHHPAERFPETFGDSQFLRRHPYFLPCAIPATFSVLAWFVTSFFLKETVVSPKPLSHLVPFRRSKLTSEESDEDSQRQKSPSLKTLLTWPVIIASANYAFLALIEITFRAIQPLFFSTPIELGGLGLPPSTIGNILSSFGILNGIVQVFFFPTIHDRLGSKRLFLTGVIATIPMILSFPVMNAVARLEGVSRTVYGLIAIQTTLTVIMSMSYGAVFIYISASPPRRSMLGATNGFAQTTVSIMRAVGPASAASLFSLSIEKQYLGGLLVYFALCALICCALFVGSLLPKQVWRRQE
ncbi:hypothetical protein ONZ45_g6135 [Pleurotus djamor]|nr:hypothetical protein ONZ45_g6135 [Pleurotus djamor]